MKYISIIVFYLISFLSFKSYAEQPLSTCLSEHPFRLTDSTCGSFEEICIKKGDENCDNLKNACKQCPATNYTSFMLIDILNVLKGLMKNMDINQRNAYKCENDVNLSIKNLTNQYESLKYQFEKYVMKNLHNMTGLISFLVVIHILIIILVLYKCIRSLNEKHDKKRQISKNKNCEQNKTLLFSGIDGYQEKMIDKILETIRNDLESLQQKLNERLDEMTCEKKRIKNDSEIPKIIENISNNESEGHDLEEHDLEYTEISMHYKNILFDKSSGNLSSKEISNSLTSLVPVSEVTVDTNNYQKD